MAKREKNSAPAPKPPKPVKLEKCPCGQVPGGINIETQGKYGTVAGSCCGEWTVEFRANYSQDKEAMLVKARTAWNTAPRG